MNGMKDCSPIEKIQSPNIPNSLNSRPQIRQAIGMNISKEQSPSGNSISRFGSNDSGFSNIIGGAQKSGQISTIGRRIEKSQSGFVQDNRKSQNPNKYPQVVEVAPSVIRQASRQLYQMNANLPAESVEILERMRQVHGDIDPQLAVSFFAKPRLNTTTSTNNSASIITKTKLSASHTPNSKNNRLQNEAAESSKKSGVSPVQKMSKKVSKAQIIAKPQIIDDISKSKSARKKEEKAKQLIQQIGASSSQSSVLIRESQTRNTKLKMSTPSCQSMKHSGIEINSNNEQNQRTLSSPLDSPSTKSAKTPKTTDKKRPYANPLVVDIDSKIVNQRRNQLIQSMINENIRKATLERQRVLEEKKQEEQAKREKQFFIQQKNLEIRNSNAARFSRGLGSQVNGQQATQDLSRRLPWGINQEKLRNYAIQVLTQYRNHDIKAQSQQKQEEKMRRERIGLDDLPEEEIIRLVQESKEKLRESQEEIHRMQQQGFNERKKEDIWNFMEEKRQKIEQDNLKKKIEKYEGVQKKKFHQAQLEGHVKMILSRLRKKKVPQTKKHPLIFIDATTRSPTTQSLHRNFAFTPIPTFGQTHSKVQGLSGSAVQFASPQSYYLIGGESKPNEQHAFHSNPYFPMHQSVSASLSSQLSSHPPLHSLHTQQFENGAMRTQMTSDYEDKELHIDTERDYSGLYDAFKMLISEEGQNSHANTPQKINTLHSFFSQPLESHIKKKNGVKGSVKKRLKTQNGLEGTTQKQKKVKKLIVEKKTRYPTDENNHNQELMSSINDPNKQASKLNKILAAKQQYDLIANRINQLKLNTSKTDSYSQNLTRINKQFLVNGEIEEKTESEDLESSLKDYNPYTDLNPQMSKDIPDPSFLAPNTFVSTQQEMMQYQIHQSIQSDNTQISFQIKDPSPFPTQQQTQSNKNTKESLNKEKTYPNSVQNNRVSNQQREEEAHGFSNIEQIQGGVDEYNDGAGGSVEFSTKEGVASQLLRLSQLEQEMSSGSMIIKSDNMLLNGDGYQHSQAFYEQLQLQQQGFTGNPMINRDRAETGKILDDIEIEGEPAPMRNAGQQQSHSKQDGSFEPMLQMEQKKSEDKNNKRHNGLPITQQVEDSQQQMSLISLVVDSDENKSNQPEINQDNAFNIHAQNTELSIQEPTEGQMSQIDVEARLGSKIHQENRFSSQSQKQSVRISYADEDNNNNPFEIDPEMDEEELEQLAMEIFTKAALQIQKVWRGYFTRKILAYYFQMQENERSNIEQVFENVDENGNVIIDDEDQIQAFDAYDEKHHQLRQQQQMTPNKQNHPQNMNSNQYHQSFQDQHEEAEFNFQGGDHHDKFVHISTIKSSVLSNEETQFHKIDCFEKSQLNLNNQQLQVRSSPEFARVEVDENEEEIEQDQVEEVGIFENMSDEDLLNWEIIQEKIMNIQESDMKKKEVWIQILSELNQTNQDRLFLCIDEFQDDEDSEGQNNQSFQIEQIEAVFSIPTSQFRKRGSTSNGDEKYKQQQLLEEEEKDCKDFGSGNSIKDSFQIQEVKNDFIVHTQPSDSIPHTSPLLQNPLELQKKQIAIQNINLEKESQDELIVGGNKKPIPNIPKLKSIEGSEDTFSPAHIAKGIIEARQSSFNSNNSSAKRQPNNIKDYEISSERSFNENRRNKFGSPVNQNYAPGKNTFSIHSDDRSVEVITPKEELSQLYTLLKKETSNAMKKEKPQLSSKNSSARSLWGSSKNLNKDSNLDMLHEYFDVDSNPNLSGRNAINDHIASGTFTKPEQQNNTGSSSTLQGSSNSIFNHNPFEDFTAKKFREIITADKINEIWKEREQALELREATEIIEMKKMLQENHVSPRTYNSKRQELESWVKKEREDIQQTRKVVEKGVLKAMESIQKTQRDVQFAERFKQKNEQQRQGMEQDEEEQDYLRKRKADLEKDIQSSRSVSENQSDLLSNSQLQKSGLKETNTPTQKSQLKLSFQQKDSKKNLDHSDDSMTYGDSTTKKYEPQSSLFKRQMGEGEFIKNERESPSNSENDNPLSNDYQEYYEGNENLLTQIKQNQYSKENSNQQQAQMKLVLNYSDIGPLKESNSQLENENNWSKQNQKSQIIDDFKQKELRDQDGRIISTQGDEEIVQSEGAITLKEEDGDIDSEVDDLRFNEKKESNENPNSYLEKQVAFQSLSSPSAEFMERSQVLAEIEDKWRTYHQIDLRLSEQLNTEVALDKSEAYGIPTNNKIILDYIQNIFTYVAENFQDDFIENLNIPFGFAPSKRLKLIHGYDQFAESSNQLEGCDERTENFTTLPFVLSEDLFVEFEQSVIGNGETEKEMIIKEFEHIHNKAIFDTFNETLNMFRPFFSLGGPPYSWTISEKNSSTRNVSKKDLNVILQKSQNKVIEWTSYLCGLVNEEEVIESIPAHDEDGNPPPLSVLLENLIPTNECLAQIREERLSKMLLAEIFENECKWQLFEDEKTEVVMELSDLVFEHLVEEVVQSLEQNMYETN